MKSFFLIFVVFDEKSFLIFLTGGDGDVDAEVAVVGEQLRDGGVEHLKISEKWT